MLLDKLQTRVSVLDSLELAHESGQQVRRLGEDHLLPWADPGPGQKGHVFPSAQVQVWALPSLGSEDLGVCAPDVWVALGGPPDDMDLCAWLDENWVFALGTSADGEDAFRDAEAPGPARGGEEAET